LALNPSHLLRLVLALLLLGSIFSAAFARPPRRPVARSKARCLTLASLALYMAGALCAVAGDYELAGYACAGGIALFALALWFAGASWPGDDPPDERGWNDGPPPPEPPPGGPQGVVAFDWDAFERDLRAYQREREPLLTR
jgi:hypothetical protein